MRFSLFFLIIFFYTNTNAQDFDNHWQPANKLLSRYVEYDKVHYYTLQKESKILQEAVQQIATTKLEKLSQAELKAFYVNAYNILVIHQAVKHLPLLSPNEYDQFYTEEAHMVGGKKYSLLALKKFIEQSYDDKRLPMLLADGTISGGTINNFAYSADKLDEEFDQKLYEVFNRLGFVDWNDKEEMIKISYLFKSYADPITFINQYRAQKIEPSYTVKYNNYNAQLNAFGKGQSDLVVSKQQANKKSMHAGISHPITIPKGKVEVSTYQSIFTTTFGPKATGIRKSYYTGFTTANYGVTGRLDIGINIMMRGFRENAPSTESPFKTLAFDRIYGNPEQNELRSDWALSHLGLQVRHAPFKKFSISLEHGIFVPIRNVPVNNGVDENFYLINQIYFYHRLSHKWDMFFTFGFWQPITPGKPFQLAPPLLNVFLTYNVTDRFSVYVNTMYGVNWGLGARFMLLPNFEINFIYNYVLPIQPVINLFAQGANNIMIYNMGIRYRF